MLLYVVLLFACSAYGINTCEECRLWCLGGHIQAECENTVCDNNTVPFYQEEVLVGLPGSYTCFFNIQPGTILQGYCGCATIGVTPTDVVNYDYPLGSFMTFDVNVMQTDCSGAPGGCLALTTTPTVTPTSTPTMTPTVGPLHSCEDCRQWCVGGHIQSECESSTCAAGLTPTYFIAEEIGFSGYRCAETASNSGMCLCETNNEILTGEVAYEYFGLMEMFPVGTPQSCLTAPDGCLVTLAPTTVSPTTAAPSSATPTTTPTVAPSSAPSVAPSASPTTVVPTGAPTSATPSASPTSATPTGAPTSIAPTNIPTTGTPTAPTPVPPHSDAFFIISIITIGVIVIMSIILVWMCCIADSLNKKIHRLPVNSNVSYQMGRERRGRRYK